MFLIRHSTLVQTAHLPGAGDCVYIRAYVGWESLSFLDLSLFLFLRASGSKIPALKSLSCITIAGLMLWAGSSFSSYEWFCGWLCSCDLWGRGGGITLPLFPSQGELSRHILIKRWLPFVVVVCHLVGESCFLIQFKQLWELRLKQNKKASQLCLMLTFKLARRLLGIRQKICATFLGG